MLLSMEMTNSDQQIGIIIENIFGHNNNQGMYDQE